MRPKRALGVAAGALLMLGGAIGSLGGASAPPGPDASAVGARRAGTVATGSGRSTSEWRSETITTSSGEQVRLELSDAYTDPAFAQSWGDFFAGLVHGTELGQVTIRIVTPAELPASCGPRALGCYTSGRIVIPGEQAGGVEAAEIARHEYGHHIAATRQNPPWNAGTWGAKRWATQAAICPRASRGEIAPDSYENYELSPREAFAEVYRVLNDRRAGVAGLTWSIVDDSFVPDDAALRAIEEDVTKPWLGPTTTRLSGRFRKGGTRQWARVVATPLDGTVTVELRLPSGRTDRLELLDDDGRVVARGLWSGTSAKRLSFVVCGQRSLRVRVTLGGAPGTFGLTIARP